MTRQVYSYNETPASNNFDIDEGGAPEGHARVKVNDSNRQRMSALASLYQSGLEWLDLLRDPTDRDTAFPVSRPTSTTIAITSGTVDLTSLFNTGRRLRTTIAGVATEDIEVLSVAYANPTTTVTIYSAGGDTVSAGVDGLLLMSISTLKRAAFAAADNASGYIIPLGFGDSDFATALAAITAAGGGTILLETGSYTLTQQHTIPANCRIIGQGIDNSILVSTADNVDALLKFTSASSAALESFSIVNNTTATLGTGHAIMFDGGVVEHVRIHDLDISLGLGDGIRFENNTSVRNVSISGVSIDTVDGNGIYCDDPNTAHDSNSIRDCRIKAHGAGGGTTYAIRVSGQWEISDVTLSELDLAGPAAQIGLGLWEKVAANPNEQDARYCSVSGISISGTGADARGIDMNGRNCSVTGAQINLSGASSIGVRVGGTLGSQLARHNKLVASSIKASVGYDEAATAAQFNTVSGCSFDECGIGVRLAANDSHVSHCTFDNSTIDDIRVANAANDNHIIGNSLRGSADNGIRVQSGADGTIILDNVVDSAAGDGIEAETGSLNTRVSQNRCLSVVGADYTNGATTEGHFIGNFPVADEVQYGKTSDQNMTTDAINNINALTGKAYPTGDGGPDGSKKYLVTLDISFQYDEAGGGAFTANIQMRSGSTGDETDPKVADTMFNPPAAVALWEDHISLSSIVTPAAGDLLTGAINLGSTAGSNVFVVRGDADDDNTRTTMHIRRMGEEV